MNQIKSTSSNTTNYVPEANLPEDYLKKFNGDLLLHIAQYLPNLSMMRRDANTLSYSTQFLDHPRGV